MKRIILILLTLALVIIPVRASSDSPTSVQSVKTISSKDSTWVLSEADENPAAQNPVTKKNKKKMLRLGLYAGSLYDNNVYRYGQEFINTFALGQRPYRYPGVKSIADVVFPIGCRTTMDLGKVTVRANVSGEIYRLNSQMNNLEWIFSLGWNGPVSVAAQYQLLPYHPIRPHSYLPYIYELMSYRKNKGTLSAQLNLWKIKPSVEGALGFYDYNHEFDNYDAPFYEGGLGVAIAKPVSVKIRCVAGAVLGKPHTNQDWSKIFGFTDADIHCPYGAWVLGIKGFVEDAGYTTRDSLDPHKGRNDFLGNGNLYVKYRWRSLGVTATTGYYWRETTSPIPRVDTRKDYGAFNVGIECSWEFKKKF